MVSESVEKLLDVVMSVLMLLIGMVMLFSIFFAAYNPYDNIAFANTEKLRAAINEACIRGTGSSVTLKSFELRQNVPLFTGVAGFLTSAIPEIMLKQSGDPIYVLYYEAFPPGEGVGWEAYQDLDYRLLTPLAAQDATVPSQDTEIYAKDQLTRFLERKPNTKVDAVLVSNIILNDAYKPEFVTFQSSGAQAAQAGSGSTPFTSGGALPQQGQIRQSLLRFGDWKNKEEITEQPTGGDNVFRFNNYAGLTPLQKSLIKYMPCGENSLCLKTRSGVYRYPLSECGNIKNVQVIYDARDRATVYTAVGLAAATVGGLVYLGGTAVTVGSAIPASAVAVAPGVYAGTTAAGETIAIFGSGGVVTGVAGGAATSGIAATAGAWVGRGALSIGKFLGRHPLITAILGSNVIESLSRYVARSFLGFKTSDLALASPCSIRGTGDSPIEIKYASCSSIDLPGTDPSHCTQVAAYPLYKYDKTTGNLVRAPKYHYVCLEKINGDVGEDITEEVPNANYDSSDMCVQIYVKEKAVGCWTPDPYKEDVDSDTQAIASLMGFDPVKSSLDYIGPQPRPGSTLEKIVVLKPSDDERLNDFTENWQEISWGWPWPFDQGVIDKVTGGRTGIL